MRKGDPVIVANTSGDVAGWSGGYKVLQSHVCDFDEELVKLSTDQASVELPSHHLVLNTAASAMEQITAA